MNPTRALLAALLLAALPACQSTPTTATAAAAPGGLSARVEGPGFLTFSDAAGRTVYARDERLALSPTRELTTSDGLLTISPPIVVPCEATLLQIDPAGAVTVWINGDQFQIGRLGFIAFANPERLTSLGHGRFTQATDAPDGFALVPLDTPACTAISAAAPDSAVLAEADLNPGSE